MRSVTHHLLTNVGMESPHSHPDFSRTVNRNYRMFDVAIKIEDFYHKEIFVL